MNTDLRQERPLSFELGFGSGRLRAGDVIQMPERKHRDFDTDFRVASWTPRSSDLAAIAGCVTGSPLILEESPERTAFRLPALLYDRNGTYSGDGVQEVVALADGTFFFGLGLRVIRCAGLRALRTAGWRLAIGSGCRSVETAAGGRLKRGLRDFEEAGDWVILRRGRRFVGVFWGSEVKGWLQPLGGEGLWAPVGDGTRPPFYRSWETRLRQWGAPHGWFAREDARLALDDRGLTLAWHAGSRLELEPVNHFSAAVAVVVGATPKEVRGRLEALAAPLPPAAVEGAVLVGYDRLEGAYRFRRTAGRCRVTFPADPWGRAAQVRVDGPPATALECSVDGEPARPGLVSVGRTDDPNAPHDGRPDGGARPVLAADERPAERALLSARLSPGRPTTIEVAASEGLSLSYLAQDDRRELLLFSSRDASAPAGRLSLHDLRFRSLRPPGAARPAAACLPLYWYMMNAPSQWQSANLLESWEFLDNGPERVRLRLSSRNPGGEVRSEFELTVSAPSAGGGALLFDVAAGLEVLAPYAVPHFQFCNLFPENTRRPEDWTHDETLLATPREVRTADNRTEAARFAKVALAPPFFLAQYGTQGEGSFPAGGGVALLVTGFRPAGTPLVWELCRCWLDNHVYAVFPEGGPAAGSRFEVRYQVLVWSGEPGGRAAVERLARAALASGSLPSLSVAGMEV